MEFKSKHTYIQDDPKEGSRYNKSLILIGVLVFIGIVFIVEANFKDIKKNINNAFVSSQKAKEVAITLQHTNGVILDKILDVRTDARSLVYKNHSNKVFVINDFQLWHKANIGDSVRVSFKEGTTGWGYKLEFLAIEVLGKAKGFKKDFTIVSSEQPDTIYNAVDVPISLPVVPSN